MLPFPTRPLAAILWIVAAAQALAEPVDVARAGTASQTSEWNGGQFPAALAIDGNPSTFSHTDGPTRNNAWELRLDSDYQITSVELAMRADCCVGRLTGATLRLFNGEGDSVYDKTITDPGQGRVAVFEIPRGVITRSLRVGFENGATNPGLATTYVHLGEVRVFAEIDLLPAIDLFRANPTNISDGASSALSWQTQEADTVEVIGHGPVAASGSLSVSPGASRVFTLVASNASGSRSRSLAITVDGALLPPRITEFMADNATTLARSDGSTPDWIELWNPNPVAIDLAGYQLTDDPEELDRFTFPAMSLAAGGYLIIDADPDSLDRVPATGFKLSSSSGSYLALHSPAGRALQSFTYPKQREDISYGEDWHGAAKYFLVPTPGEASATGTVDGFVSDTQFSVRRGFFDQPQVVSISTATPAAKIYTTTDGSEPSPDNPSAALYSTPLPISTTTVLRAAAFLEGYEPTDIDTQTYIFPDDVASQSSAPANFPQAWVPNLSGVQSSVPALSHFGMDDGVLATLPLTDRAGQRFDMPDALTAIPSMSLVMDADDLFDPADGIHVNARNRGRAWERRASIEFIDPGTGESVQANCGIRTHGGWNRYPEMLKKSFRLYFRSEYGDAKLRFPLFPDEATDEFDRIILRSGNGKAWPSPWRALSGGGNSLERNTYLRDQFMRDLQAEMDNDHVAGRFVHLYVNGHYWGLYNPVERPDEHFASSHFGGQDEDYDVIKWIRGTGHRTASGSDAGWNELVALARSGPADQTTYEAIAARLDLPNFIDYMLLNYFAGNIDWVDNNVYALRDRANDGPFKFYCWDSEETFLSPGRDSTAQRVSDTSTELHHALRANSEYGLLFGDRAQKHLFNGGALTQARTDTALMRRAWAIDRAIVGDSARWGNLLRPWDPYDRADWLKEVQNLRDNYLGNRVGTTLAQLRTNRLFPDLDAPAFSPQRGGQVEAGMVVSLSSPNEQPGTVYYTTDGSDPRVPGGAVSPSAAPFTTVSVLIPQAGEWHYLDDGADLGTSDVVAGHADYGVANWKHPDFDHSQWSSGAAPLGYGSITATTIQTTLSFGSETALKHTTSYFRREFQVAGKERFQSLRLRLMRDDGAIVYLNGHEAARSSFPAATTTVTSTTFASPVGGADEGVFVEFALSPSLLVEGKNVLAVELHQASANSSDLGFDLELAGDVLAGGIAITGDTFVRARVLAGGEWSALDEALFLVGDRAADLFASEIMYHPGAPLPAEAEFIEIANRGTITHHLGDLRLTGGILFDFSDATQAALAPGERLLLARDVTAFEGAYPGVEIAGRYDGALGNGGDTFSLEQDDGTLLWTISYDDSDPWPSAADGGGYSLSYIDGDPNTLDSWRPSAMPGGSPGSTDSIPFTTGNLVGYAMVESYAQLDPSGMPEFHITTNLGADDAIVIAEWSTDLTTWNSQDLLRVRQSPAGDGTAEEIWKLSGPAIRERLFFRSRVSLR